MSERWHENSGGMRSCYLEDMRDMMLEKRPQNKGDVQGSSAWKYEGQDVGKWPQKQVVQGVISTEM